MDKEVTPADPLNDVLEIKKINLEQRFVEFENLATSEQIVFPFGCWTIFEPLLDGREYTLGAVKRIFGFPAKVRFVGTPRASRSGEDPDPSLTSIESVVSPRLGKITIGLHGVITDSVVISSKVGGINVSDRKSITLPKNLNFRIRLAEGLISEEEAYVNIVETLHARRPRDLCDEQLDVYHYLDGNTNHVELFGSLDYKKGPELPLRNLPAKHATPPKRPQKPSSSHLPRISTHNQPSCKQTSLSTPSYSQGNDIFKGDSFLYDDILEHPESHIYTCIDMENVQENEYELVDDLKRPRKSELEDGYYETVVPQSKSDAGPSRCSSSSASSAGTPTPIRRMATKDLLGLSVDGVGKLLKDLHMGGYVGTFKEELVDGEMLSSMDQESLESLKMSDFHITKLMKIVQGWRPKV